MQRKIRSRTAERGKQNNMVEISIEQKKPSTCPGRVIRYRRGLLGWKAIEMARRAGINPRTYDAIEKGRIESPSLKNLEAIACALGVSVGSLFAKCSDDGGSEGIFMGGNQKGLHTLEFAKDGFRMICYTPFVPNIFVGKVVVKGETRIEHRVLPTSGLIFAQAIMGKLSIHFDDKDHLIREGSYAFFDGCSPHSFYNPQYRESTFLLVTAPSFLSRNPVS